jgi:hypothetical protein
VVALKPERKPLDHLAEESPDETGRAAKTSRNDGRTFAATNEPSAWTS